MRRNYYSGPPISRNAGQILVGATRAGLAGGAGAGEFRLDLRSRCVRVVWLLVSSEVVYVGLLGVTTQFLLSLHVRQYCCTVPATAAAAINTCVPTLVGRARTVDCDM